MEAEHNGLSRDEFLTRVKAGEIDGLEFLDPETVVHHIDGDSRNNALENLEIIDSQAAHAALHSGEYTGNVLYKATTDEVLRVEAFGEEMTYDIEVADDPHNFLANGFVVHNTGKTSAGQLTALEAVANGWTFISARPGDDVNEVLKTAQLYQPAVVFIEDVDNQTSTGDADEVAKLLETFDGVTSKGTEIALLMTTNHFERIHKAMLRPGRIDAVITVSELDRNGIERLVRAVVKSNRLDAAVDYDAVFEAMSIEYNGKIHTFLPAFVREALERAKTFAIGRQHGSTDYLLQTQDLVNSAHSLHSQLRSQMEATEGFTPDALEVQFKKLVESSVDGTQMTYESGESFGQLKIEDI